MDVKVLDLDSYMAKFHEKKRGGCRYRVDGGLIYRERGGEFEDVAEFPSELATFDIPSLELPAGAYVGEPLTIDRLRSLIERLSAILRDIEALLRT